MPTVTKPAKAADKEKDAPDAAVQEEKVEEASKREIAAKAKADAEAKARAAKLESGDLIVGSTHEFESASRETKTGSQVAAIVKAVKASKEPVVFADAVEAAGGSYPEDLLPAMYALEALGMVKRFDAVPVAPDGKKRRTAAYLWVQA